jgi:predicted SAM-dependent methyltransferase
MNKLHQVAQKIKRSLYNGFIFNKARLKFLSNNGRLKLIIGSGSARQKGWIATDISLLDITNPQNWNSLFYPESINRILSEHVFEHFDENELNKILILCYKYLSPKGILRIAVPDKNRKDPIYQQEILPPKDDHKLAFTVDSLTNTLKKNGFRVNPLEYFDDIGIFHSKAWTDDSGIIRRSSKYDKQEKFKCGKLFYTSIIVDAHK